MARGKNPQNSSLLVVDAIKMVSFWVVLCFRMLQSSESDVSNEDLDFTKSECFS